MGQKTYRICIMDVLEPCTITSLADENHETDYHLKTTTPTIEEEQHNTGVLTMTLYEILEYTLDRFEVLKWIVNGVISEENRSKGYTAVRSALNSLKLLYHFGRDILSNTSFTINPFGENWAYHKY